MPAYTVYFKNVTDVGIRVEGAANPEAAIELAESMLPGPLCIHCSSHRNDGDWEFNSIVDDRDREIDLDGEPV